MAQATATPSSVNFGGVALSTTSAAENVLFKNTGSAAVSISSISVTAGTGYKLTGIGSPACSTSGAVAAGGSCNISITFSPGALGSQDGTLTIASTASGSPTTVALSGTGIVATEALPTTVAFGNVAVGSTSVERGFSLTNNEPTAISVAPITAPTPYSISSTTCGATLAAKSSCEVFVTFLPSAVGPVQPSSITLATSGTNSPLTVNLTGTGVSPSAVSPSSVNFGNVAVGATSAVHTVTLSNNEETLINLPTLTAPSPFAISSTTCGSTLAASSSCTISLTMTPTTAVAVSKSMTISTNALNSPLTLTLMGTGYTLASLSAPSLSLGNVVVGATSPVQSLQLVNQETTSITITSITVPAPYKLASTTCGTTLGSNSQCSISVTLTPTVVGAVPPTSLAVSISGSSTALTAALTGTGIAPTLVSPASVNFGNVVVNTSSALSVVTVTNEQTTSLTVTSLSVTAGSPYGIDPSSTCRTPTVPAGGSCTVALYLTPTTAGSQPVGSLTIATNAVLNPPPVPLSGNGISAVTLSPPSINFGNGVVGIRTGAKTFTIANNESSTLTFTGAVFNGPFVLDTSAATTCPMTGGALSGTLAAGHSCTIGVDFAPTAVGSTSGGQLTVLTSASNSPQVGGLSGTGALAVSVLPSPVNFGSVVLNKASAVTNVTVTNQQAVALHFSSITTSAPFAIVAPTTGTQCLVGTAVAAGGSCNVGLTLTPTSVGPTAAVSLTLADDARTSPQTVSLVGQGEVAVSLAANLNFGNVALGELATQTTTLTNNQTVPLAISAISGFSGSYSLNTTSTTCSTTSALAAGGSCVIAVNLTATALGTQAAASFSVSDNAPSSPQVVSLTGDAVTPVTLTPNTFTFPATIQGQTSAIQVTELTNNQSTPMKISTIGITGADPSDFTVGGTCPTAPNSLPAGQTCQINLAFAPTASGSRTATLSVADNSPNSPQTASLTGTGNASVVVSPDTTQTFTANVGAASASTTFTITNERTNAPLIFSPALLTGDFTQSATTCPIGGTGLGGTGTVASCTISVKFNPSVGGVRNGQLQVNDNAVTTPQVVNLTGTGTSPLTLAPAALSFTSQQVGTASPASVVTLTNHESKAETFTFSAVGALVAADFQASSTCTNGVIAANSSCLIFVNFTPMSVTPSATRTGTLTVTDSATGGSTLSATLTGTATATPPPAAVTTVSPGAGQTGATVPVIITGNGWTHFSNSSTIKFVEENNTAVACNIAVSGISANSANSLKATLTLSGTTYGACNIAVTSPLTGGGTETASLVSAFNLSETPAQTLSGVSPAFGTQGETLNVNITGVGTNFQQGVTIGNFGDGIEVNSLTVNSPTSLMANITISNTTPIGYRTITLQTNGEFAVSSVVNGNPAFQILANNATLLSVSPQLSPVVATMLAQGSSEALYITASGTHFLQNATTVTIGGVVVGDVTVTSLTTAVVQVAVPSGAPLGLQNATVTTGGEIASLGDAITITGATPALIAVAPSSGVQGQNNLDVILTGNAYTTFNVGALSSEFTGEITVNKTTALSASSVDANISIHANANAGPITATLVNGTTNFPFTFTVQPSASSISGVSPACIPQGGQLTLNLAGVNTDWVQGTTIGSFYAGGGAPVVNEVIIKSATSAQLAVTVPTTTPPGSYGFYMATGGQVLNASMCVTANTPTLTMSPANGVLPTGSGTSTLTVNFTGQFTHWAASTLPVISGEGVTLSDFVVNSPVSASGVITLIGSTNGTPTATGTRTVTLTTGGEIVTTNFNVTSTPVGIVSVTPDHTAPSISSFNVAIVGLNTHFSQATTIVQFGPQITVNSVTVTDTSHLTANISTSYLLSNVLTPSPSGWQNIFVNTGTEQVMAGFLVDYPAVPGLVSVTPSSGAQGQTLNDVVITGSLTDWVQGTTEAILGAGITVSNLTITSPTTATATIAISPTAPVGGNTVVMYTGSQIVSGSGFSVTPSAASIQSVEPNFTCPAQYTNNIQGFNCTPGSAPTGVAVVAQLQTVTLNIVGVGTHWLQGETTVSFGPGVVTDALTVSSPTTAQVQITVLSSAPLGFATLTVSTGGETVSLQQAIDLEEGSPTLLAITPSSGQQGTTMNLQVLGRFTHFNATPGLTITSAAFNQDITVNSLQIIDSENLIANITISPLAYVGCGDDLTITTGNEQVSTGAIGDNFCVAQGAEEITGVTPVLGVQGSSETVTITGSATDFVNGETQVSFGDPGVAVGTVTVLNPTTLSVPLAISTAATTGYHTATVTTLGEVASQQYAFTVSPGVATLNEAIPYQMQQGVQEQKVRLIGQYSHFNANTTVTMGAGVTIVSISNVSTTEEDAVIDIDPLSYAGSRVVTVSSPGVPCSDQPPVGTNIQGFTYAGCTPGSSAGTGTEILTNSVFTIIPGPAIITAVSPNTANEGQEVVVNLKGSATHWQQNFTQFYIAGGGSDITINSVIINSATSATVDMSISATANPGARSVYMVTNGESLTDSGAFVVTGGVPVITYLSPNSQQNNPSTGTTGLEVAIHGLYTKWATGSTTINFGPGITVASFQVDDATDIEAVINIAASAQDGYRTVVVTTGAQTLTGNFQVTAPAPPPTPSIGYLSPGSALPGQTLNITFGGSYTQWVPGTTELKGFATGITVNTFQVLGPASAIANITIPANAAASTSDLTMTTGSEVENAQFSVVIAQPVLSVVDPGSGLQGATDLTVNILGQYTTFDSTTTFSFGPNITVNGPPVILGPTIATQSISIPILAPLGGTSVVAHTPDAAAIAQTVGGAGFSITPSLALIASITPNTSPQGATVTVTLTGQNTHWDGSTIFTFGDGIVVASAEVSGETSATLTLVIPAYAGEGPTGATATTAGEVANISNGFVVTAGTPYLLSSGPGSVPQQGAVVFTVLSQATTWISTPPTVSFGPWITLTNVNVTSDTSLTVQGYVLPTAPVGYYNLTVSTGTQTLGLSNAVYISAGPAVINSVTPNVGDQNANLSVQINGINTHWVQGTTTLNFPDMLINSFVVNSPTSITANITVDATAPAGQYSVTATTGGEVATGVNVFTVSQSEPELLAVVPNSGPQGLTASPVNLTGDFTSFVNGTTTANFGTGITVNSVTVTSATTAQANITVSPITTLGYRNVSVTTGSQVVAIPNAYQVSQGPAEIVGPLNPAVGGQGQQVTVNITGSQTHFAQNVTTAAFGGGIQVTQVTINSLTSATVNITIPTTTALGAYNVVLTTGGEVATIVGGFTVNNGSPQISGVNPPTGTQGSTINVALTGTFTHFNTASGCAPSCSVASFGTGITVNSFVASDATDGVANITISTTATITSYTPTVTTGSEVATKVGGFSVLAGVPALESASPGTAQAGTTANVVINGFLTNFQQSFTTVSFGSGVTVNFITVNSQTQLTANITIASNATVGPRTIQVTTLGQSVQLSGEFTVTAGTPIITQINPNYGNPGQTALQVTIFGQYTNWVNGTTVASFQQSVTGITVTSTVVSNATTLVATINIPSGAPLGPVDVVTTTGGEVENVPGGFTVQAATIPAPTLVSVSPGPNNSDNVPINSSFTVVFSSPMNRTTINTSTFEMWLVSNPNSGYITVPGTVTVDATGRVATFTPSSLLAVNSQYYMLLTNGIQDATGNTFAQYGYVSFYTVDSATTKPSTVVAVNPPANTTRVGTNVTVQLEFSADMNQSTQTGLVVSTGGTPVAGTWSWNSYAYGNPYWGPGTILSFTPTNPYTANTTYKVSYGAPLADTAGNAVTPGSFSFTTGSAADTTQNYTSYDFNSGQGNLGTNFAPRILFSKPVNPIDINAGTLLLYNNDSGKYIGGTITIAANSLSATFTPTYPLLPDTYYDLHMSGGSYDMDGNTLNGNDGVFTTGAGTDTTAPTVASVSPANSATSVPLNAQVTVHFGTPINPESVSSAITVTPAGGSAIEGTATLASDLVTFTFVPLADLAPGTVFTVHVSGYTDMVGNAGVAFTSTFTTATSIGPINVSTGLNAAGQLITTNNTNDAHWVYIPQSSTPTETTFGCPSSGAGCTTGTALPLQTVGPGDADWYSAWVANGPGADWIAINPNSTSGNTFGLYYTTFNISGSVPANQCLVGTMSIDDNGLLAINGTAIMSNINNNTTSYGLNIPVTTYLKTGQNVLSLGWGSTDNYIEGLRLDASIQTCGASFTGGLTLTSAVPANNATGVATNSTITLNFNNTIDPATVNATTLPIMIGWNSNQEIGGTYQVTGSQVIFTPDSPFPTNTNIWVGACGGPMDTAGDGAGNCYTQLTNFTTGSTASAPTAPFQVVAFTPSNNATNVGLRAPVTATFNRSVNPYTINQNSATADFGLFAGDGQSPWCGGGSYSRSQDNKSISFNCYALPSDTPMTAMLNSNLTDWTGDPLTNFSSQFTTAIWDSNTNGTVITSRPGNAASGISANEPITLFMSLPINASTASGGVEVSQNNVAVPGTVNALDGGYTLEFTPSVPWTPGALIQWWTAGTLLDTTYNTPVNGAYGYFYAAAGTSTLVPAVQAESPGQNIGSVPVNAFFDLQFNTPLNASTVIPANVYVFDGSNGNLQIPVTMSQPQSNEIRLVPTSNLPANHYIYVELTTGLESATSVPLASNTNWYVYTSSPADSTLPVVQSAVPYNGATNVGVNVTPGVVVSKPVDPVSVNSSTFTVSNGGTPLAGSFWFNSNDTRVEFVPNAPLPASTNLVMKLNGVLDHVGNSISYTSSFTTGAGPDFVQPTVVYSSVSGNESIPTNSAIKVQFSESMDVTTFASGQPSGCGNFYIQDQLPNDGISCIPTTLTWNSSQTIAYLTPTAPLAAGREYYFYVGGGTDLAGNQMQADAFYFYADLTPTSAGPTVIAFNPLSGFTGLGTNAIIEAEFSAPVDPNTVSAVTLAKGGSTVTTTPSLSAGNTVLQLIPAVPLTPNATYTMTISGVKDPAGNPVATVTNSFTTGATYDVNPATAINSDPADNTTVGTNVTPKIVFNKPLNPITVNTSTFNMYLNDTGQYIPATVTESASGTEVTITPLIPLLPTTQYHFRACCGFQDQDGNNGNGVDLYFWTNSGSVTTGPTVTVSPLNGSTGNPTNSQIYVETSTPIDPTSWTQNSIQLLKGTTAVAGTVTVPNAQTLIFTPTSALAASTVYTVKVTGFTDADGNPVMPSTTTFTTGATAATGGLTLTSTSIVNGSNVTNNVSPITLTFSQILNPSTVNLSDFLVMNSWNSNWGIAGSYVVSGNSVTFTPSNPYPPNATIYVGATGGLTDVAGDAYGGSQSDGWQQLLYFTTTGDTPDSTALKVMSVSPAAGATNVRPDTPVSVTFNKGINPYSVYNNGNNALLFAGQSVQDRGSISMSADNRTLTFSSGVLYTGTTYTIQLPAGGISDPSGNTLASTYSSTFTTGTNPAAGNGGVQSVEPGSNATGVPTDSLLTLFLSRQVNPSTLTGNVVVTVNGQIYGGTVQATADDYEVQYTPSTPFPNGAAVQWWFSALGTVLDVNGDPMNGTSGYFYTAPTVNSATAVPVDVNNSPGTGAINVPTNADIYLQFSEPLNAATLNTTNVYLYDNTTGTYPTVTVSQPEPGVIKLAPASPLVASSAYYACANGSVQGSNGVANGSGCWNTNFTTGTTADNASGTVIIGPANATTGIGTNAYIRLVFSKPINRAMFNAGATPNATVTIGGSAIPGTWSFAYNSGTNDAVGAYFTPVNPLPPSTSVSVAESGVLDYAGNSFASASSTFTTAALPDYSTPSVTLDFGGGQTGIGTNASFTCLYSEPIDPSSITSSNTYVYSYISNATIPVTYAWASDLMAVTMTPKTALFANSEYNYNCSGGIDLTGNGESNGNSYFYTGNGSVAVGPVLINANPVNGATNVPLNSTGNPWYNTSLGLQFNEPVSADSMANITFTPQGGTAEPIAVYPEIGNTLAVVQLPYTLQPNTKYTFSVPATVTDLNGNPATPATSSFTTGSGFDWTNPTVTTVTPANNATGVAVTVHPTITFSEPMNPTLFDSNHVYLETANTSTVIPTTFALSTNGSNETVVTLTPTAPLAESTIYSVVLSNPEGWDLYDWAGNYFVNYGVQTQFTTGTTAAVNGTCGTANGLASSTAPAGNLCSTGTASLVTEPYSAGSYGWAWSCNGEYGGTNASCSAPATGTPVCSAQLSSLEGFWPGNDNAKDFSPNGYNGTLENGVTYALGEVGDAFNFLANSSTADEYVLIGQPVPTNLQIQDAITLSAWIYPTALPGNNGSGNFAFIMGSQEDGVYAGASIMFDGSTDDNGESDVPPGHIQFQLGDGSNWHETDTQSQVPLNQWTLITAVRSAGNPAQVYFNGVLQPSATAYDATWNGTVSYPSNDWFAIGQEVNENRPFIGLINDVQVYKAALTQAQVQAIYNAGRGGVCQ
ncbi:MAG: Ig-like domain-containing protein [Terracidiphilus sp.]